MKVSSPTHHVNRHRTRCNSYTAQCEIGQIDCSDHRESRRSGFGWALGATCLAIIRLVVGGGAFPLFIGILVGLGGAIGLARFIQSMLFATDPIDPLTLAGVSVLFAAVALTACLVPACRASRVDPMAALRQE